LDLILNDDPLLRDGSAGVPSGTGPAGPSLLMDLRPCYDGYAGIPQEARLLFALFSGLRLRRLGGLASGVHFTSRRGRAASPYERTLEQTKVLIAQHTGRSHWPAGLDLLLGKRARRALAKPRIMLGEMLRAERLDLRIDSEIFADYLWMKLFDRTLAPSARSILQRAEFYATEIGHEHARSISMLPLPFQRRLRSRGWDLFFAATVSPYRPADGTGLMIRYYDALPLLSPHTLGEPWAHALSHARMLLRNMRAGADFYCASEPVREELLQLFPDAEARVHTIPVTVAPDYYPDPRSDRDLRTILLRRRSQTTLFLPNDLPEKLPKLFMAVATLEPRKNYLKLFRAFEIARSITAEPMQLLVVANPGWRSEGELTELQALVSEGAFHLSDVPLRELRVLYSMAHCVVAPSRAEGFDYSGAEGMACGTPVIASDIPVHRWVYGEAAEYFDPYDEEQLGRMMARFAEQDRTGGHLATLRDRGLRRAMLYRPEALAPRWEAAIQQAAARRVAIAG
jgi:glycosyltransferase involved in cell wall biosynthesis